MRYFTIKWWEGKVENPMALNDAYCRYMESVRNSLPPGLRRLHWRFSLHDAHLRRMSFAKGTLELQLDGERRDAGKLSPGRRKFRLSYRDVCSIKSIADPRRGLGGPHGYGDLGYDEIEVLPKGLFEHRLLFSSGIEVRIRFADFALAYEDVAGRLPAGRKPPAGKSKRRPGSSASTRGPSPRPRSNSDHGRTTSGSKS